MIKKNKIIYGFKVKRIVKLESLCSILFEFEHIRTGAKYIHLKNNDNENTFCITFKTIPQDSTGVAHILEHTVLSGSKKYPIKDPFFSMLKRSLNTFMNAFTSSDWTAYPFSTQNKKDFYNLLSVYLDSVFYPKISELSFKQEGCRFDFEQDNLVYKGIVYNEMKGSMSSATQVMEESIKKSLFPTTTYHFNSGGEPAIIPRLSYKEFKLFHKRFYHPSNAYFYSYGNFDLIEHLNFINKFYLSKFKKINPKTNVNIEKNWNKPKKIIYNYPALFNKELKDKFQVSVSWRMVNAEESFENLSLEILENILIGNSASPLRKALVESGLGSGLSDGTGFETEFRSSIFSCGLKDVKKQDALKVKEIIFNTLEELVKNGVDSELIDSAIHKIEFAHKEITNTPYPYGIHINLNLINSWLHGGDPVRVLQFNKDLNKIYSTIKKGNFFENQIKKYFINNNNQVFLTLAPDSTMHKKEENRVKKELEVIKKKLTQAEISKIKKDAVALERLQESYEDTSCLPALGIIDIPKEIQITKSEKINSKLIYYNKTTNDILYFRASFEILDILNNSRLIKLLPLFCYLFHKMGTKKRNYIELAQLVSNYTGGISLSVNAEMSYKKDCKYLQFIILDVKCLNRNKKKMYELINELINEFDFSNLSVLKNYILEYTSKLDARVIDEGHYYAMLLSSRNFSQISNLEEEWHGIHRLKNIKKITTKLDQKELKKISQELTIIGKIIFKKENIKIGSVGDLNKKEVVNLNSIINISQTSVENIKSSPISIPNLPLVREAWITSTNVSFVVCSFSVITMNHKDAPILFVISKILSLNYLHRELREKRGAYSGFARYNFENGIFYFASYRDPHIISTLEVYTKAMEYIRRGEYCDQDIKEAIVQSCSSLDKPESPADEAKDAFERELIFLTDKMRLDFKKAILGATHDQVVKVAKKYFNKKWQDCSVAVITSRAKANKVNKKLGKNKLKVYEI